MAYPRDYITKKVQEEKQIITIIDKYCNENPEAIEEPRDCFLAIREILLKEGLYSEDNAILAKSYFVDKAMSVETELESYEEYEKER